MSAVGELFDPLLRSGQDEGGYYWIVIHTFLWDWMVKWEGVRRIDTLVGCCFVRLSPTRHLGVAVLERDLLFSESFGGKAQSFYRTEAREKGFDIVEWKRRRIDLLMIVLYGVSSLLLIAIHLEPSSTDTLCQKRYSSLSPGNETHLFSEQKRTH